MFIVREIEIEFTVYHSTPVGMLRYKKENGEYEASGLYTPAELTNIINCWKMNTLMGSFGIDTVLHREAYIVMTSKE